MIVRWIWIGMVSAVIASSGSSALAAMKPATDAGRLLIKLERLMQFGRVLYVAAHPDDENTRLLAYLVNGRHLEAAYLSMTRGGGGQNLIGAEQTELLGVIRTQELLAARRIDGAAQRFTRTVDFGYSKTPEETLTKWGREAALSDVVRTIRAFRPDIVITRFSEKGGGHGHHTASAILARAAFHAAADATKFPEQLAEGLTVWKASRLLLNVPWWGRDKAELQRFMSIDAGGYDARLGLSYGELAAISRSQHKSQGFGSSGRRGPQPEYFEFIAGRKPRGDPLEGIRFDWGRIAGGSMVAKHLKAARRAFDPARPERSVPALLRAYAAIDVLIERDPSDPRLVAKKRAIAETAADALGLFARVTADRPEAAPTETVKLEAEVVLRRPFALAVSRIAWPDHVDRQDHPLTPNEPVKLERSIQLAADHPVSMLTQDTAGAPEGPPALDIQLVFGSGARRFALTLPVIHTWTDPVHGERSRRFAVVPFATVTPLASKVMFPRGTTKTVSVVVRAGKGPLDADVRLEGAAGWKIVPEDAPVVLEKAEEETTVTFEVTPPADAKGGLEVQPVVLTDEQQSSIRADLIDHPHIPVQRILRPARMTFVPMEFEAPPGILGYIQGSGDAVPDSLRQVGLTVEEIDDDALRSGDFSRFRAIMLGIRAYNTRSVLPSIYEPLMSWVRKGGTLVVQYNTNNRWRRLEMPIGPFPFEIGRDRVTHENAPMTFLQPDHAVLRSPNRLTASDFDGWIQERGLYFAKTWDKRYQTVFKTQDPGDSPSEGSVLVTPVGKGAFVYTGLSFFRQLPAGVPGAYRLLANLLAYGR